MLYERDLNQHTQNSQNSQQYWPDDRVLIELAFGGIAINIHISGNINLDDQKPWRTLINTFLHNPEIERINLNIAGIKLLDSGAMALLTWAAVECKIRSQYFEIFHLTNDQRRIIERMKLGTILLRSP